ncbi:MAG: hypothetical protein LUB61_02085 [Eggerthellaceae bacterium]|nr:hypothetical protein [Eggerthellaceae bacterium]
MVNVWEEYKKYGIFIYDDLIAEVYDFDMAKLFQEYLVKEGYKEVSLIPLNADPD